MTTSKGTNYTANAAEQTKPSMLSLLRARLRPPKGLSYSTTGNGDMAGLTNMLIETAEKNPVPLANIKAPGTNRPVQEYRPITPGSFIRPYDLSLAGRSWPTRPMPRRPGLPPSTRDARKMDVFYQLGVDPLKLALHPEVLDKYMSEMAMIQPRRITQLTMKSQRRIAKAIRRSKMMGVIPLFSRPRKNFPFWPGWPGSQSGSSRSLSHGQMAICVATAPPAKRLTSITVLDRAGTPLHVPGLLPFLQVC
ncbi:hypothetical protein B0H11DRAFT_2271494 [Mycena galericulata]|nr:hypothetical protein B0H11DRAFT_2271494 [Mycena galericulata]